ncbi:MAG TPA: hypothetical protein VMS93_08945 [Candidatus Saccharimonadales bacterium]|nr:hypothetical protein [Candidatus Saccharimonadales bacterium]
MNRQRRVVCWLGIAGFAAVCISCASRIESPPPNKPASGWIVYSVADSGSLWNVRLDGSGARCLGVTGISPSWNPSASEVSYFLDAAMPGDPYHSYLLDQTGAARPFLTAAFCSPIEWRPDGREVIADGQIYTAAGDRVAFAVASPQVVAGDTVFFGQLYQWAGDTLQALMTGFEHAPGSRPASSNPYDYYLVNVHGGTITARLSHGHYTMGSVRGQLAGVLSPDRRQLMTPTGSGIVILNTVTQHETWLTQQQATWARWGSDSKTVVFIDGGFQLCRASLDSVGVTRTVTSRRVRTMSADIHLD